MYAIKINNISKVYKVYDKPSNRIKDIIFNTKNYKEYHALKNISVDIPKGDAVGVLGKNGAGKSTLLKIITGVVKPSSGEVNIDGKISAILELNSGFDDELSGYENIYIKGSILGYSKKDIEKRIDEIIEFADIGDHIHQPVRTYSSGMKSRLGFAIAVNVDPDILIIDEALAVGDDIFKSKCLNKMSEFRKQGKTIFFVSHSLFTIKSFCTKCMWMKDGELVVFDELKKVMPLYENFLKEEKVKNKKRKNEESNKTETMKDIIEASKFKFKNNSNKFKFEESIEYTFDYEVKKPITGLRWSFTIRDSEKKEIYSTDKMSHKYNIESGIGKHSIGVKIKDINLLPGTYLLSGELREESGLIYVGYSNKRKFEVSQDENYRGSGVIHFNHELQFNK